MTPDELRRYLPYLIVPLVLLVLFFRIRRMQTKRPLRIEWLWVAPAMLIAVGGLLLAQFPPSGLQWAWLLAPLALGGLLGWYRGKMIHIEVVPETHALTARASPAALYLIVGIIVVRYAVNALARDQAQAWGVSAMFVTDLLMVFGVATIGVSRVEMFIRAQRLLAGARATKASAAQTS